MKDDANRSDGAISHSVDLPIADEEISDNCWIVYTWDLRHLFILGNRPSSRHRLP